LGKKEEFDEKEYVELFAKFMEYRIKLSNVYAVFDGETLSVFRERYLDKNPLKVFNLENSDISKLGI